MLPLTDFIAGTFPGFTMAPATGWLWPWDRPGNYGWYHICWLVIMVLACLFFCLRFARKHEERTDVRVIFGIGVFLFVIELYKQVFYTVDAGHFQWYAFPFQFCSVPMFVALLLPLFKNERAREVLYRFLAFFGLLAGIAVMAYPDSCFHTDYVTILIHTMLWHVSLVVMGVYLIVSRGYCSDPKRMLREIGGGTLVFAVVVTLALAANLIGYKLYFGTELNRTGEILFLMYISPYYENPFPILGTIKEQVPFPVFFLAYLAAFAVGVTVLWLSVFGIRRLTASVRKREPLSSPEGKP